MHKVQVVWDRHTQMHAGDDPCGGFLRIIPLPQQELHVHSIDNE